MVGVFLGIIGLLLLGQILEGLAELFANPVTWIVLGVIVILIVIAFVKISKNIEIEEEEKRKQAEEEARRKSFYRCPYCGEDYSDILNWHDPFGEDELQRCSRTCMRHFYFSESQTPRTSEHRRLLEAEARDAARIASSEFDSARRMAYQTFNRSRSAKFLVFERDHAFIYVSYPTKSTEFCYHDLETEAGKTLLAISCMKYVQEQCRSLSYYTFQLTDHGFSWEAHFN